MRTSRILPVAWEVTRRNDYRGFSYGVDSTRSHSSTYTERLTNGRRFGRHTSIHTFDLGFARAD
jgi:hypothetical protein